MGFTMPLSDDAARNRAFWDRVADEYQAQHRDFIGRPEPRWGVWQIPEAELSVLGEVRGKDVLELGCGAAQWSILLARAGARPVGLDNSARQLEHARAAQAAAGLDFPLLHASADGVPLPDASFDIVFCDYGAMHFADPHRTLPECARLLRPGGLLAFSTIGPLLELCWPAEDAEPGPELKRDYFGLHRIDDPDGSVSFNLPYGEWIRLFRRHGFLIEELIESRPPEGSVSTYRSETARKWARRWPAEIIWKVRRG